MASNLEPALRAITRMLGVLVLAMPAACAAPSGPSRSTVSPPRATLAMPTRTVAAPTASPTAASEPSATRVAQAPLPAATQPLASATAVAQRIAPTQPLRTWTVSPANGTVYVLDATQRLLRLAPGSLAVQGSSPPLFDATGSGAVAWWE